MSGSTGTWVWLLGADEWVETQSTSLQLVHNCQCNPQYLGICAHGCMEEATH